MGDANMPDTDILSSHKLCDVVDKILPSAFGTMIKTNRKQKSLKKKKPHKTQLERIGEKTRAECLMDVSPVLRTTVRYGAQLRACLERCWR